MVRLILYDNVTCNKEMYKWFQVIVGNDKRRLTRFKDFMGKTNDNVFYSLFALRKEIIDVNMGIKPDDLRVDDEGVINFCTWCEEVFVQPVDVDMGIYIHNIIESTGLTEEYLYQEHLKNPYARVERIISKIKNIDVQIIDRSTSYNNKTNLFLSMIS